MRHPDLTKGPDGTTEEEYNTRRRTLLDEYEYNHVNANGKSKEDRDDKDDNISITQWFPDVNEWNIEEIEREIGCIHGKLGSKWSVQKTMLFLRAVDREIGDKLTRGKKILKGKKRSNGYLNELDFGLGLYKLIEIANDVYGVHNWMTTIRGSSIDTYDAIDVAEGGGEICDKKEDILDLHDHDLKELEMENESGYVDTVKCNIVMTSTVTLILADNTVVEKTGYGYAYNLPKGMAFKKSKKESVSDAMKSCFGELVVLLYDYEEKVRNGYYNKYT